MRAPSATRATICTCDQTPAPGTVASSSRPSSPDMSTEKAASPSPSLRERSSWLDGRCDQASQSARREIGPRCFRCCKPISGVEASGRIGATGRSSRRHAGSRHPRAGDPALRFLSSTFRQETGFRAFRVRLSPDGDRGASEKVRPAGDRRARARDESERETTLRC